MNDFARSIYKNSSIPAPFRNWVRLIAANQPTTRLMKQYRKFFFQSLEPEIPVVGEDSWLFRLMLKYEWLDEFLHIHGIERDLTFEEMMALEYDEE